MALLGDFIDKEDSSTRIGAIMGLGIAYAGSQNEQVRFFSSCNTLLRCFSLYICENNFFDLLFLSVAIQVGTYSE